MSRYLSRVLTRLWVAWALLMLSGFAVGQASPQVSQMRVVAKSNISAVKVAAPIKPRVHVPAKVTSHSLPNLAAKKGFVLLGLVVQDSTMNDLASIFDAFQVQLTGGEQDALTVSACYLAKDGSYLEFDADDDNDNESGRIKEMTLSKASPVTPSAKCDSTNLFSASVGFKNGIRLGMDKDDVLDKLGDPEDIGNHKFIYSYDHDQMDVEVEFDRDNKVESISLYKLDVAQR